MNAVQDAYPNIYHAMNSLPEKLITLGIPEFEFPRSDLKTDVRYFGAFKKLVVRAVKGRRNYLSVSQGTVEVNPEDIILPTLEALKDYDDVLVTATLVVSEPEQVPNLMVPNNAQVAKFIPYDLLLPMTDLLISNGGYRAVQHCLRLGIPLVVSGLGQDKATTNSIVQWPDGRGCEGLDELKGRK
ncbi:hypothetical protein CC78DRAFT_612471 [Lojkania enalia]|uniref:Uncharacterized protein n=1 Tax=Lojkania enalia TaxID=147567 RepID=A0A9P4NA92_9PLEO|nr:hypothetical protein CC78DRAFT_612471 [Didymosphaeria enalia]